MTKVAHNNSDEQSNQTGPLENLMFKGHLGITVRVIAITVGLMVLLGGGGYLLDLWLGTKPWFLIGGLIIAFPVIQLTIYRQFRGLTSRLSEKGSQSPDAQEPKDHNTEYN